MIKEFSHQTRTENIQKMSDSFYDLVIIGGGITGAGAARDAASRGMKVALVEMSDFASGTSSRSSKLIHGGIRYLEHFEFHLVYEALSERSLLFELAPHLVHPLRFLLPMYKSARVGNFKMSCGMWLYDLLSAFEAPQMHERLTSFETLHRMPILRPQELTGSFVYSDAYMDDDRLTIETLRSANNKGAHLANYVKVHGAIMNEGKVSAVECTDLKTKKDFTIRGRHFISTVGPWTDRLGEEMFSPWKKVMRPSKGIHITLDRQRLPLECAVVMASDKDNRIVFGIPRHEMVIIGTTDTDFPQDPTTVKSEISDIKYLLNIVGEFFPGANLKADDIIGSYAGVRPLVHDDHAETESGTSREHLILNDPRNITFVAGGKYTTYRRMAEQTINSAMQYFSLEDQAKFSNNSTKTPINPKIDIHTYDLALSQVRTIKDDLGLSLSQTELLVNRHGAEWEDLLKFNSENKLQGKERLYAFEALHAIENTMCLGLRDFYLRRVPLFLAELDHGMSVLESISKIFATRLSWNDAKLKEEVALLKEHMESELAWKKGFATS